MYYCESLVPNVVLVFFFFVQVDDEENGSSSGESEYEAAVYEAAVVAEELERVRLGHSSNSSNAGGGNGIQELGPVQWDFPPIKLAHSVAALPAAVVEPVPLVAPPSALSQAACLLGTIAIYVCPLLLRLS